MRGALALLGGLAGRLGVLLLVALGVFGLLELGAGDAADAYLAGTGGGDAAFAAAVRERLGLHGTALERLAVYLGRLVTLDLGTSIAFGRPVTALLAERLPVTLLLMGAALVLAAAVGTALGALATLSQRRWVEGAVGTGVLVLNATPSFLLALAGIVLFAVELRWLPLGGLGPAGASPFAAPGELARHLVLPVATLALTQLAPYARVTRAALRGVMEQPFVTAARARGVRGARLAVRHVLRPALGPVVTLFGVQAGLVLGGSVVVETVFAIPGFGSLAAAAVAQRDVALLAGVVLAGAVVVLVANGVADGLLRLVDPRTRGAA